MTIENKKRENLNQTKGKKETIGNELEKQSFKQEKEASSKKPKKKKESFMEQLSRKKAEKASKLLSATESKKADPVSSFDDMIKKYPAFAIMGNKLIVEDFDKEIVQEHIRDLGLIPSHIIEKISKEYVKIHIGNKGMTGLDNNESSKGVVPRGWEDSGKTWDDVPGCYDPSKRFVCAGKGGHGSISVVLHEVGHSIGHTLNYDNNSELKEIHNEIYPKLSPYLQQGGLGGEAGRQEFFAELFAATLKNPQKATLRYGERAVSFIRKQFLE